MLYNFPKYTSQLVVQSSGPTSTLTLATSLRPSAKVAFSHSSYAILPSENGESVPERLEFKKLVVTVVAWLGVAGRTVNSFAYHLKFRSVPPHLRVNSKKGWWRLEEFIASKDGAARFA